MPVGFEGVKVNQWGGNRGVQDYTIRTGRVFFNPMTEDVFVYPIYLQNYQFTEDQRDTSPGNEAIVFNSREGVPVTTDVGLGLLIPAGQAPHLLVKYRQDAYAIIHGPVRTLMWNEFNRQGEKMGVLDIMGAKKSDLVDGVFAAVRDSLRMTDNIHMEYISLLSRPRVTPEVEASITATIVATQRAIEAQNMIVAATAQARQVVETARGDSLSNVIRAQGQAKANDVLNASITPDVLEWMRIKQWTGTLPLATGDGALPFLNLEKK